MKNETKKKTPFVVLNKDRYFQERTYNGCCEGLHKKFVGINTHSVCRICPVF